MAWWRKREQDLERELRAHLELEAEELDGDTLAEILHAWKSYSAFRRSG